MYGGMNGQLMTGLKFWCNRSDIFKPITKDQGLRRFFFDTVLRKLFGLVRKEVSGSGTKLHIDSEKVHDLYCSPNIIRVMKSGRPKWPEHVLCVA
jgi:hypothetical protein